MTGQRKSLEATGIETHIEELKHTLRTHLQNFLGVEFSTDDVQTLMLFLKNHIRVVVTDILDKHLQGDQTREQLIEHEYLKYSLAGDKILFNTFMNIAQRDKQQFVEHTIPELKKSGASVGVSEPKDHVLQGTGEMLVRTTNVEGILLKYRALHPKQDTAV